MKSRNGYSLSEMMMTIAVILLTAGVSIPTFASYLERERTNAIANVLAGWLDAVSLRPEQIGTTCEVTVNSGTLAPGAVLATVTPATCSAEPMLRLPTMHQVDSVRVAATATRFFFTPRGSITTSSTASNANTSITIRMSLTDGDIMRCVRLTGALAYLTLGRNSSTGNTSTECNIWRHI